MTDTTRTVTPTAETIAMAIVTTTRPISDRLRALEQRASILAGPETFGRYTLAEYCQMTEYLADVLAERPVRPDEPRMVADARSRAEQGIR